MADKEYTYNFHSSIFPDIKPVTFQAVVFSIDSSTTRPQETIFQILVLKDVLETIAYIETFTGKIKNISYNRYYAMLLIITFTSLSVYFYIFNNVLVKKLNVIKKSNKYKILGNKKTQETYEGALSVGGINAQESYDGALSVSEAGEGKLSIHDGREGSLSNK